MATIKTKKICSKCKKFYTTKICNNCNKQQQKEYNKTYRNKDVKKIYNSALWKKVRLQAMANSGFMCVYCKEKGISTEAKEVDHFVEVQDIKNLFDINGNINKNNKEAMALAFGLDNLKPTCVSCHRAKTEKEKRDGKYRSR